MAEQSGLGRTSLSMESALHSRNPELSPRRHPGSQKQIAAIFDLKEDHWPERLATAESLQDWVDMAARAHSEKTRKLGFFTSGSSGEPVICSHEMWVYEQEVDFLAGFFSEVGRIICLAPPHHIYGFLFGVLLPKALAVPVEYLEPLPNAALVHSLGDGDLLVAFPLVWKGLAALDQRFMPGVWGITSTGPCPAEVILRMKELGIMRLTEVYGSSQTGGVGYRHDPKVPYTLMPFWGPDKNGYAWERRHPQTGKPHIFQLQDELDWLGEDSFRPVRRTDKATVVAGINVYPSKVREVILRHPGIKDCAVRPMSDAEGNRLKAFIVPQDENRPVPELLKDLQRHLKHSLKSPEIPRAIKSGTAAAHEQAGQNTGLVISRWVDTFRPSGRQPFIVRCGQRRHAAPCPHKGTYGSGRGYGSVHDRAY